jgi:hypothetical protein
MENVETDDASNHKLLQQLAIADKRIVYLQTTIDELEQELTKEKRLRQEAELFTAQMVRAQLVSR